MARKVLLLAAIGGRAMGSAAGLGAAQMARMDVTPLQKVLQMLGDLSAKGKQEKHNEEVEFAKYQEWCDDTRTTTQASIKEGSAQIEQLSADISKAEADAEGLAGEIKELETTIAGTQSELKEAVAVRKGEADDYAATHKDLSESVDAIERAHATLSAKKEDVPQSLLQVASSASLPREAKAALQSFLALGADGAEAAAPEANAYEFQSGGVTKLLEKLRLKFQDQRTAVEKAEMNAKHNHEQLAQKLTDNIKEDTKRLGDKKQRKAQRLEDAGTAKGELEVTEKGKAEDEKKLSETLAACQSRSVEFEKNQVVRSEEIKAIAQAMEILQSDEVTGTAGKHLPSLAQQEAAVAALLQLRGGESPEEAQRRESLTMFLQGRAKNLGSRYLSMVAEHAAEDPFTKVKKMMKDMIVKLMEEANSEADSKAFCDAELATNKQTRENKQSEVEELSATSEKLTAESAQLADELAALSDAVAVARKQQAEATKLRTEEKAANAQTVAEAKAAQVAVERATKVLKDFYAKAADASLLQGGGGLRQEMTQAITEPYTGMQSSQGGIVGFLEVILSDFARLEAETSSAEDSAASAYEKFMDETTQDIAVKSTAIEHKTDKKEDTDTMNANVKKELSLTQEELDAALEYYEKLKPDCVDHGLSYEERVRLRQEEIQSLKEALEMLNQQDLV